MTGKKSRVIMALRMRDAWQQTTDNEDSDY
jgi:hypothetical protein